MRLVENFQFSWQKCQAGEKQPASSSVYRNAEKNKETQHSRKKCTKNRWKTNFWFCASGDVDTRWRLFPPAHHHILRYLPEIRGNLPSWCNHCENIVWHYRHGTVGQISDSIYSSMVPRAKTKISHLKIIERSKKIVMVSFILI